MAEKKPEFVHELIPEHTKLSEKEAKALLKSYNVTLRELPKIFFNDPAIAHLDAKEGDIIRIRRKSRTAGETVFYRGIIKE
jgi:DNA-directed RNA polymerase subunit H